MSKTIETLQYNGLTLHYELEYKKVKNVNLRIRPDGTVYVSAGKHIPKAAVRNFVESKAEFIIRALARFAERAEEVPTAQCSAEEICDVITGLCEKVYPYYKKYGVTRPQLRFRKMISRWGSCQPEKGILTFNINLMYAPPSCVEYVVWHEFTHFLEANHSAAFYEELEKVCPDWRACRKKLKTIPLRRDNACQAGM